MKQYPVWFNDENRIFRAEDAPVYMPEVGIRAIFPEKGRAIFYGILPEHKDLAQVLENKSVEIVNASCGNPADYEAGDAIICLHRCRIRTSWVLDPVTLRSELSSLMFIYVSVDCGVEFYKSKGENDG